MVMKGDFIDVKIYYIKSKNSFTIVKFIDRRYEVLYCSNFDICRRMNIFKCPPYCEKIVAVKKLHFHGMKTKNFEIEEIPENALENYLNLAKNV